MTDGRPLDGVKIVDLTHVLAGPYCTYILALLGANVIKIENVDSGDVVRQAGPRRDLNEIGMGSHYQAQGGDKRCIAVDIASDGGKAVLARLIATADVFIENLRPGATSGHGFDPATLRARHPRLICARVSGFGADQPRRAYDNVVQAASGIVASTGPEGGPAVKAGPAVVDYATGLTAALALLAALRERDHTGKGAFVDVAMHDVALALQTFEMANFFVGDTIPRPHGNTTSTNAGYSAYETRDGPIMIGAYTPELQRRLWQVLGEKDRAIAPTLYDVGERSGEDARDLAAHLARRSSAELEAALQAAGVPAARIRTLDAALDDATGARRPVVVAAPADTTDTAAMPRFPGLPFKLDDAGFGLRHAPRRHGADTRAVLMELGYSNDEIDRLAATGAIRCA